MADGYARVSGRHGVCIAQNGPGITNFVTSTAAAFWAHSPVVVITPETGSMTLGLGGFQETEQLPIFSKITKFQAHVNNRARMAELTSRAFDRARSRWDPRSSTFRATSSTATSSARYRGRWRSNAARAAKEASMRPRRSWRRRNSRCSCAAAAS